MAKKHFLLPSKLVKKVPVLHKFVWLLEAVVVKSLVGLIRTLPPDYAYGFANTLFRLLKPLLPFSAKIRRNLGIAFPHKDKPEIERLTRAICGNLGRAAVDLALAGRIWQERAQRLEFVIEDGVDLESFRDKPVVMVEGHIGAWQIGTLFAAQYDLDVTSVYAPEQNPYLKDYFERLRVALPVTWISRDGCIRPLSKKLKQGQMVGLVTDTRYDGGEPVDFFGTSTLANPSAARLALRYKCDLIPVHVDRLEGSRFRITAHNPIRPADPDAPIDEQARQMTLDMFKHFEAWIRADPAQWICFSRRWP